MNNITELRTLIRASLFIAWSCVGATFLLKFAAAYFGWRQGLWDRSGYPKNGVSLHNIFSCTDQIRNSFAQSNLQSSSMSADFGKEILFSAIITISVGLLLNYIFPFGPKSVQMRRVVRESNIKIPRYVTVFIIAWLLIFSVDLARYYLTSIYPVNKAFFTWSSFCISGLRITIIDKAASFFEAGFFALVYTWLLFFSSSKLVPILHLYHSDGECGVKAYAIFWHRVAIASFVSIVGGTAIWSWYLPISAHPEDRFYALTPALIVCLFIIIYFRIARRTYEIRGLYAKLLGREIRIIETRNGINTPESRKIIKDIPPDPTDRYLGRLGFEALALSLLGIFLSAFWLLAYLMRIVDQRPEIPAILRRFF